MSGALAPHCSILFLIIFRSSCTPVCHGCFVQGYEDSFGTAGCYCRLCKPLNLAEFESLETSGSAAIEKFWIQPAVIDQMCAFWARSSKPLQPSDSPSLKVTKGTEKDLALPAALAFESGCVSLEASLFFEWCNQTQDTPPLDEFREKVNNMPKRVRLYWSRFFDFVSSSAAPSELQIFMGTQEIMRVCPNNSCGLSFRQESSSGSANTSAVAFVCHSNCLCDHTLDGPCELCHLPFQNHTRHPGSGRKCAAGTTGLWQHQIDMKTECPYCNVSFCEKCFLPWNAASSDGTRTKTHAGLLCPTFKGLVDNDCDEDSLRRTQKEDTAAIAAVNAAAIAAATAAADAAANAAAKAAAEEARLVAESGSKNCPRCAYGPVLHDRGHHCHHVTCHACSHRFCFCCLSSELWSCGCPLFCSALCDCPPCTTCRFGKGCELCDDGSGPTEEGRSPYFRMPAKEVAAYEVNRQRKHEAAVEQEKKRNPKWPGDT